MRLRFLLDEDTERALASKLRRAGHDVQRVVDVDALGVDAADAEVRTYARRFDRILVTHDDDHDAVASPEPRVFYCPTSGCRRSTCSASSRTLSRRIPSGTSYRLRSTLRKRGWKIEVE
jgi:hypothetical protein